MPPLTDEDAEALVRAALEAAGKVADAQEAQANKTTNEADEETQTDWDGGVLFGTEIGARMIARRIRSLSPADIVTRFKETKHGQG